ncbi:MAG: adenylate/guanylate cyclase domain-containing protein [Candidatus Baltobacteraceae bacterium]
MAKYHWTWWFACSRETLWKRVSDTDWMNRESGLPPVQYQYVPLATGGSRTKAKIKMGPLTVDWVEPPFEWSQPEYHQIRRRYENGPLRFFSTRMQLTEERGGTRVETFVELQARAGFGWLVPLLAARGKRGNGRALKKVAKEIAKGTIAVEKPDVPQLFGRAELQAAGFADELLDKLAFYLETSDDRDLAKIRAYEIADRWSEPRRTVLNLFLTATRIGALNLSWDVLCGNCRGTQVKADKLEKLSETVHCAGCNVQFGPQFDRSVEVTFNAHPLGKGLDVPTFCLVGPHMSRHVVAQEPLAPSSSGSLRFAIAPGRYVAKAMMIGQLPFAVEAEDGTARMNAAVDRQGVSGIPASIKASELALQLTNDLDRDVLLRIESSQWPDTIVTAADVTAMQEFRDLFSSEVLASGLELGIQSMTVLFTDLVGSTAMYSRSGDAPAFRIVNEHFDQMRVIITQYDGAIVKTIGDAVMAVFRDSGKCLEAALRLANAVGMVEYEGAKLQLRVGFHSGPCIAMRANDRLDYFGTTVNLASRLEHAAAGGEVAFTASTGTFPHMQSVIQKYNLHPVREDLRIKGFAQAVGVLRVPAFAR